MYGFHCKMVGWSLWSKLDTIFLMHSGLSSFQYILVKKSHKKLSNLHPHTFPGNPKSHSFQQNHTELITRFEIALGKQ